MKKALSEGTILIFSIVKWILLSTLVGVIEGLSTSAFLKLLRISIQTTDSINYSYLALPFGLFLSSILIKYSASGAEGHGTEKDR